MSMTPSWIHGYFLRKDHSNASWILRLLLRLHLPQLPLHLLLLHLPLHLPQLPLHLLLLHLPLHLLELSFPVEVDLEVSTFVYFELSLLMLLSCAWMCFELQYDA
jgi:hypothetical protein